MTRAFLALGGNLGDVAGQFGAALRALAAHEGVSVAELSRVYRTAPWGLKDQPDFLNMAAALDVTLSARELLDLCLRIEQASGRLRHERWGPRNIDLDIIAYGDETIDEPDLVVPHPRAHERAFVLAPLADIAPELMLKGQRVRDLLAQADASGVSMDEPATSRVRNKNG